MIMLFGSMLALDSIEFKEIDDEVIAGIINEAKENEEMYYFLNFIKTNLKNTKTYEEKINYYSSLLNRALSITKIKYAPEFFELFLAYLMRLYINIEPQSLELVNKVINKFDKEKDNLTDEMWFLLYSLKHILLNNIDYDKIFSSTEETEKLKIFLNDLKINKERYEKIQKGNF